MLRAAQKFRLEIAQQPKSRSKTRPPKQSLYAPNDQKHYKLNTLIANGVFCVFASARLLRVVVEVCLPPLPQQWSRDPFG